MHHRTLLVTLFLFAFLLRVWGLPFGLPYQFHPDEHQYVTEALNWHLTGQLHTGTVNPPLFIYILAVVYKPWLILSPFEPSTAWITSAYTYARLWSVAFGLLSVALAYPLGLRLHSRTVGFLAALLLAGLFLPARETHFAVNDTAATFFALLVIYAALGILQRGRRIDYALAGVATGLAAATKLNVALVALAPLVAHGLAVAPLGQHRLRARPARSRAWGSLGLALLTFGLVSLPLFLDAPRFIENIGKHLQFGSEGYKGLQMAPVAGWLYYLYVLGWGGGWLLVLAVLRGLAWIVASRYRPGYVVAIFPVTLFLYMGAQKILFARFLLPAVPPLVLLAALALVGWIVRWPFFQRRRRWLWPTTVVLLLIQPLANLLWFNHLLTLPDTRQLATDWLLATYPPDIVLVKESYSVLPGLFLVEQNWPFKTIQIDERGPNRNDPDYYLAHKTNLIAVSNFTYGRVRQDPTEEHARQTQLANLARQAELVKTFNPYRTTPAWFYLDELYGPAGEVLQRVSPGPLIKIYRLPYENQPYSTAVPAISVPVNANFGNKMMLLGYDLPTRRAEPGGSIPVTLYWQTPARISETLVVFNRLLDTNQQSWGGYDRWPQETANTNLWHSGEVVVDGFAVPVSPDAPDGVYHIVVGLYNQSDPAAHSIELVQDGQPTDVTSVTFGPVKIGGPPPGVTITQAHPQTVTNNIFGDQIKLLGFDLTQGSGVRGQESGGQLDNSSNSSSSPNLPNSLNLTFYWQALRQPEADYTVFVHVRDEADNVVAQMDRPPTNGVYPTSVWSTGEIIPDEITVPLPANLPPGRYPVVVGLYDFATGQRLPVTGQPGDFVELTGITPAQ